MERDFDPHLPVRCYSLELPGWASPLFGRGSDAYIGPGGNHVSPLPARRLFPSPPFGDLRQAGYFDQTSSFFSFYQFNPPRSQTIQQAFPDFFFWICPPSPPPCFFRFSYSSMRLVFSVSEGPTIFPPLFSVFCRYSVLESLNFASSPLMGIPFCYCPCLSWDEANEGVLPVLTPSFFPKSPLQSFISNRD